MKRKPTNNVLLRSGVINRIYSLRGEKVMLDKDLAEMYGVPTSRLNEAVKRNLDRFPEDFMFQLSPIEWESLISQFAIPKTIRGGTRFFPYAFTEQGVAMLSSILNSKRAIAVNIQIMRVFVNIRSLASQHTDVLRKIENLERKASDHDGDIREIFLSLKTLLAPPVSPESKKQIGFVIPSKGKTTPQQKLKLKPKSKKKH